MVLKTHAKPSIAQESAAWIFATSSDETKNGSALRTRLSAEVRRPIRLVQKRDQLRDLTRVVKETANEFGLSDEDVADALDYLRPWAILRRCCGSQMSASYRAVLHRTAPANASFCSKLDIAAVESEFLRSKIVLRFGRRSPAVLGLSCERDGKLAEGYCRAANAAIERERLPFNADLTYLNSRTLIWIDAWIDAWMERSSYRLLSQPRRLLWSPPLSGMGDQIKALVTAFWISLIENRRLEVVPGSVFGAVFSFGGADVRPTSSPDAHLADQKLALVTMGSRLMQRWADELHPENGSLHAERTTHVHEWNIGDQTASILKTGWLAALGVPGGARATELSAAVMHRRATELSAAVMHRLVRPVDTAPLRTMQAALTTRSTSARICLQMRTGIYWRSASKKKSALMSLRKAAKEANTNKDESNLAKVASSFFAVSTRAVPRINDAELLGIPGITNSLEDVSAFPKCASQIQAQEDRNLSWYASSDSVSLLGQMRSTYGSTVVTAPWRPQHTSAVQVLQYSQMAAEWQVLTDQCAHLVIGNSSFGLTAAAVAQTFRGASLHIIVDPVRNPNCSAHARYVYIANHPWISHRGGRPELSAVPRGVATAKGSKHPSLQGSKAP